MASPRQFALLLLLALAVATQADTSTFRPTSARTASIKPAPSDVTVTTTPLKKQDTTAEQLETPALRTRGGAAVANTLPNALAGTVAFALIEKLVKMGLAASDVQFPGQLGACIVLFVALCLLDVVAPSAAAQIFDALTPGAAILAKWLPVFFVPGLVLLPLSPSIPGSVDVSCRRE